ncbi:MAG: HAD family hydrolase [Thermovirgaceae bacterium]|nr:HAD family hydrolase [Thermovirgaceae bacterium]
MNSIGIVFDVDGVLVDTSRSFPEVVSGAVHLFANSITGLESIPLLFTKEHYIKAKTHPMFNDDYDIAWTFLSWAVSNTASITREGWADPEAWSAALEKCTLDPLIWVPQAFGSDVDRNAVREACEEMYFGEEFFLSVRKTATKHVKISGLWKREQPFLNNRWQSFVDPVGIYTGRSREEMELALRLLDWEDFPRERCITPDDGLKKPSAEGLYRLEKILGVSEIFFFGDSESDRKAFEGYGRGRFFPIGEVFSSTAGSYKTVEEALAGAGVEI